MPTAQKMQALLQALVGQEKPLSMGGLLLTLVLSLHLWAAIWMLQPSEPVTKAQPMIMEVSLVSAPSQQAAAAPIAQPKPVEPKKPPEKSRSRKSSRLSANKWSFQSRRLWPMKCCLRHRRRIGTGSGSD
jgi:hypothetical protein